MTVSAAENRIKVLPDSVANQIAAGEVVQRPASVVKELLENALDAGAQNIILNIKDAGRTLIQVIDDGCGMSELDARLCIERHATSKISQVDDIFKLVTMGFRGEAMASITAVSQSELRTKTDSDELATVLRLSGNEVESQELQTGKTGTSVSVKNLFFNVPARRNFLKSNNVEYRHILDCFQQIALTRPDVAFRLVNNDNEVYRLEKSNLKQRIIQLFGKRFDERLVPISEKTDIVEIEGFVGKPEYASSKRGEQFFFANSRYIKMPYFHYAVMQAYESLIPSTEFPQYFIFMKVDPAQLDVNIHPTKTEVKFIEEKAIYAILRTTIRQSLGKFNLAPTLDFERETAFDVPRLEKGRSLKMPEIRVDKNFNPFNPPERSERSASIKPNLDYAASIYDIQPQPEIRTSRMNSGDTGIPEGHSIIVQLHNKFILTPIRNGFMLIDQHRAHQRILFERFIKAETSHFPSQQLLFPVLLELSPADFSLMEEFREMFGNMGFSLEVFGNDCYSVNGVPAVETASNNEDEVRSMLHAILEDLRNETQDSLHTDLSKPAISLARQLAIPAGRKMSETEIRELVDSLFACEMPFTLPGGKPVAINISLEDLSKRFQY